MGGREEGFGVGSPVGDDDGYFGCVEFFVGDDVMLDGRGEGPLVVRNFVGSPDGDDD